MTGTIEINGLRIFARHGVDPQERRVGNLFEVSIHIRYPIWDAMRNDRISTTLNYARIVVLIKKVMETPSDLLENVVYRLYSALLKSYPSISGGMIRVAKITPPIPAELHDVAVKIEW